jgi:hypothetical protein
MRVTPGVDASHPSSRGAHGRAPTGRSFFRDMGSLHATRTRRWALIALAPLVAGCGGGASIRPAATELPPNKTMSGHVSTCVRPRHARLDAFTFDGHKLPFEVVAGREPHCRGAALRILRIQELAVDGRPAFVRRGGCDRPARHSRCVAQPTVHVLAADLARVVLAPGYRNGNGVAVSGCVRDALTQPAAVDRDLDRMLYKRPADLPGHSVAGARWSNYGNPGRRFGRASFSYLLWNLPRTPSGVLPGGGIVEAVLAQGQRVRLCGAPTLSLASFDVHGRSNGRVRFSYAAVGDGAATIYGWVMRGYRYRDRGFVHTVRLVARGGTRGERLR